MIRVCIISLIIQLLLQAAAQQAHAVGSADANTLCQAATADAELGSGVPNQLLGAISRVETGRYDPQAGSLRAWPWTINAQGKGHYYPSKEAAVEAARAFQAAGIQSIDVGCMQINLMYHPTGFGSIEEAFDPHANAAYAARFLTDLFHQTGSWPHAAAAYHSQTPDLGIDYQRKVLDAWAEPIDRPDGPSGRHRPAAAPDPRPGVATAYAGLSTPTDSAGPASVGARPLGGFGHVIRTEPAGGGHGSLLGFQGRTLAAYRALPVAVAFLPPRGLRN